MPETITINGRSIDRGEKVLTKLNISKLPSGTVIEIPVYVFRSVHDGPVVLLMAGMHGDEVNGIEIIRRMLGKKMLYPLRGTIIAVPILNIYGFLNFSRDVPDGKDVNRSFPGRNEGSLASRVAYRFMKEVMPYIDYGIDFHTGGSSRSNYPQIRCVLDYPKNVELSQAFGAPFVLDASFRTGSLRKEAWKHGKTILVYEAGESLRFDEVGICTGIEGTCRFLHHLGMMAGAPAAAQEPVVCHKDVWIRAKNAGLFRSIVRTGEQVKKNQLLGTITDPYGEMEVKIIATSAGYIIGLNNMPVVNQGDALVHIAF
ncbi:succinylglutamate desuccinylase/aspartoacylase family protein [Pontibacter qinzhouensis]|uniref:Succinylglutamate desuccinylase/aspartoacylase family protein n=1 Tax=Pontibacter qinzhouensis TaxID=2603253 RepID=A0A5C8KA61_9BACT|nr:succinylglutamate desuccinylase/aspartoacylase family protein [Pontibacter qinzhouensis]TXK49008.1 succinylglutamate desuccinylase/aspartoacylase family protein [Pontibacter qinzhouensis]